MQGWTTLRELVREEFTQSREEGKSAVAIEAIRAEWKNAGDDEALLSTLFERLLALPVEPDFLFDEPSDLSAIRALRPAAVALPALDLTDAALLDKLHGAWLGRCAGCALGKPVEGFMGSHNGLDSWLRQKTYLTAIAPSEWPLRDYYPAHSPAEAETGRVWCEASQREHIAYMETDDDIRYTVLGQVILRENGPDFLSAHVAKAWLSRLSYAQVCTAETQAYRNLAWRHSELRWNAVKDPESWEWVAHHQNPYREWIGAQIRIDSYGYAAPGNPELAAEFAYRDARISHVKNGIYGAMLCAAMISAAFVTDDVHLIVAAGLAQIPATSRLHAEMTQVIAICSKHEYQAGSFEIILREVYALLDHYHPVHTNNNAALCVVATLLSGGDFSLGITRAVMGGWDSDCNGATVGSIVGAITGAARAPEFWTGRLNDTLNSEVLGYHPIAISECARRSLEIARNVQATAGGSSTD